MTSILELAQGIQLALKALAMYTASHPRTQAAKQALHSQFAALLQERASFQLNVSNRVLFFDGQPLEAQNLHVAALVRQFSERAIAGIHVHRGVTEDEVLALLSILTLKPAKLDELGGVARAFERENLRHINLSQTQYREVREGEEGAGEKAQERTEPDPAKPLPAPQEVWDLAAMALAWGSSLSAAQRDPGLDDLLGTQTPSSAPWPGALPPADLSGLGSVAERMGWGTALPEGAKLEAFRLALLGLKGPQQLAVVAGQTTLPMQPPALRLGFQAIAPELFASATLGLLQEGIPWEDLQDGLFGLMSQTPHNQLYLEILAAHFTAQGRDASPVEALARRVAWQGHTTEGRLKQLQEGASLWDASMEQRLTFLKELLDQGRTQAFLELLDQLIHALAVDNPAIREDAARTLATVTAWALDPGLPGEAEGPLFEGLTAHFGWEPLSHIHRVGAEALAPLLALQACRGERIWALNHLQELENLCEMLEAHQAWRAEALQRLRDRLAEPDCMAAAIEALHKADPHALQTDVLPYFAALEAPAARVLMAHLAEEADRRRRAKLMEALRSLGPAVLPALHAALQGQPWYVTRNALNLLSELGGPEDLADIPRHLRAPDPRVRQAAVRALWKAGGKASEAHLMDQLLSTDPETQLEIVFALGQLQALAAAPTLLTLAGTASTPERLRVKAIEAVANIGRPDMAAGLGDLVRRKGRIFTTAEPSAVRHAAARALGTLATPEARALLVALVAAEPKGTDRDAFQAALDRLTP